MAKKDKKAAKKGTNKATIGASAKDLGFKYGVQDLADALGIEPASARVKLRNAEVEMDGQVYGWKNDKDFQAVVKELGGKKSSKKDDDEDRKSSKKSSKASSKKASAKAKKSPRREEPEEDEEEEGEE